MSRRYRWLWALASLGFGLSAWAQSQGPSPAPARRADASPSTARASPAGRHLSEIEARWRSSLEAFAEADRVQAPPPGGVLFVGSSSIRLWTNLEAQFDVTPAIIKRGFGGSRLEDCARYADRLVLPYRPRLVVVYAGDNDLAEGATPLAVLRSFQRLVQVVQLDLPQTRIAYVSIKPSPLRLALLPKMEEANRLIQEYVRNLPNLDYIDVYTKMLDSTGLPRADLYQADQLHLNAQGYALWRREIAEHLDWTPPAGGLMPRPEATSTATAR